jgi:4a-hydroxytetrahydrobiopterin dehydratase
MTTAEKLDEAALAAWLRAHPGWALQEGKLHTVYAFDDFAAAFGWMTRVAAVAEELSHHPEWFNVYGAVTVWLETHDAGGLTALDLTLADAMEDLLP